MHGAYQFTQDAKYFQKYLCHEPPKIILKSYRVSFYIDIHVHASNKKNLFIQ